MGVEPADDWRRGDVVDTPPPTSPPAFELVPDSVSGTPLWPVQEILDGAFFVIGTVLVMWLGWIVVTVGFNGWFAIVSVFLFWVLLAYVGLPRLQEVLSKVYVPDYFIGRSLTEVGVLGDPINLALDGSEADIHAAMAKAGWVRAEELTIGSSWRIVLSSVLRRPYPEAPVSSLFLFGQRQAFAYQQEVNGNASQRHHVRFWPVPDGWKLPGGFQVEWLAAATYDRAVGISLFTLQVTHRVDSDIDIERDYVINTVRYVVPEASLRVITEYSSAFTTRNGGGDVVRTDGSLPILDLTRLQAPEPDRVEPATDALSRAVSHRVPPPSLLAAGVMSMAKAGLTLAVVLVAILRRDSPPANASTLELTVMGAGALGLVGLWVLHARPPRLGSDRPHGRVHRGGGHTAARPQCRHRSEVPGVDEHRDHRPHPHRGELQRGPALGESRSARLSTPCAGQGSRCQEQDRDALCHPKSSPSRSAEGFWSGSRSIRKELSRPRRLAMRGTSSASCSERLRASLLMATTSASTAGGSPVICSASWVLLMTSASPSRAAAICCCWAAGITSLLSVIWVKLNDRAASMMPPAMARPKESPKDPAAELTPAASLTRSGSTGASV